MTQLSIVIPAYNEEDRIKPCLSKTLAFLDRQPYESEVVVVSDGSKDHTVEVAETLGAQFKTPLRALHYTPNRGKGYAVRYGMLAATGKRVLFMDADYAVPITDVDKAFAVMDQGNDIAIGSRGISGATVKVSQNLARALSARAYTLVQNTWLGFSYPDTQCGFKMFTKDAAQALFSKQKLSSVIFDAEILWMAKKLGFRAGQFPVTWTHIEDSRIQYDSFRKYLFVFQELFRVRTLHPELKGR
ncbi:MAG: dolichyl-phosphate beta-glucosyltransferase [Thermodesulfobacteriota bacterium]